MAKQTIALGTAPTGVGGDTPRTAFTKTQQNFDELYAADLISYKRSNVLGVVSQSGGMPTGALMEYVSNATGEVWKFANGLMLTSQSISCPALSWTAGTGVRYLNVTASLPGGFAATPKLYAQLVDQDISTRSAWVTNVTAPTLSTLSAWLAATSGTTGAGAFVLNVHAIGRWY